MSGPAGDITRRPGGAYVWVTWLTDLLAGDRQCWWALWYRANFQGWVPIPDPTFDSLEWQENHRRMVDERTKELKADGFTVQTEDQNKFSMRGKAATLGGKMDIVASDGDTVLITDAKGGKRRNGHVYQVLIYMFAEKYRPERTHPLLPVPSITGELFYKDGAVPVPFEQLTPEREARIIAALKMVAGPEPEHTPSVSECGMCPLPKTVCGKRLDEAPNYRPVEYEADAF